MIISPDRKYTVKGQDKALYPNKMLNNMFSYHLAALGLMPGLHMEGK
jgi:hypothetical protein